MLVLDIDADFMLNDNACEPESHLGKETHLRVSGKRLAEVVGQMISSGTRIIPVVDHQESLYVWDVMKVRNAECIHIDAHHDCWGNYFSLGRGTRRNNIGCGNYLVQAMVDDVVKTVTYVPALFRTAVLEEEDLKYEISGLVSPMRVKVESWCKFIHTVGNRGKASIVTVCVSPEWFPKRFVSSFRDLCKGLRIRETLVEEVLQRADKKWKHIRTNGIVSGQSIIPYDFEFPYESRRQLRGKRLDQLAGDIRRCSQVRG